MLHIRSHKGKGINISSNKIQNGDVLVPANSGPPGKWPLKRTETPFLAKTNRNTLGFSFSASTTAHKREGASFLLHRRQYHSNKQITATKMSLVVNTQSVLSRCYDLRACGFVRRCDGALPQLAYTALWGSDVTRG